MVDWNASGVALKRSFSVDSLYVMTIRVVAIKYNIHSLNTYKADPAEPMIPSEHMTIQVC